MLVLLTHLHRRIKPGNCDSYVFQATQLEFYSCSGRAFSGRRSLRLLGKQIWLASVYQLQVNACTCGRVESFNQRLWGHKLPGNYDGIVMYPSAGMLAMENLHADIGLGLIWPFRKYGKHCYSLIYYFDKTISTENTEYCIFLSVN